MWTQEAPAPPRRRPFLQSRGAGREARQALGPAIEIWQSRAEFN